MGHNRHLIHICQKISHIIYLLNIGVKIYKSHIQELFQIVFDEEEFQMAKGNQMNSHISS